MDFVSWGADGGLRIDRGAMLRWLEGVAIARDEVDEARLIEARAELETYAWNHARSAELSLEMIAAHMPKRAERPFRVLELGGAPYYFSALMHAVFDVELTAVSVEAGSWPGEPARQPEGRVVLELRDASGRRELPIDVRVFNIEKDPFPLSSDSFDIVLCMEVLEHLGYSPSHMLAESHRVLRPGGLMFITVPNFINIKRTVNMLRNHPTEFPYSGYGIYGRHQREFAPSEVAALLEACHFEIAALNTANVWPTFRDHFVTGVGNAILNLVTRLPLPWFVAKREYILCAARPIGEPLVAYPAWLYEHRQLYPDPPNGIAIWREP